MSKASEWAKKKAEVEESELACDWGYVDEDGDLHIYTNSRGRPACLDSKEALAFALWIIATFGEKA